MIKKSNGITKGGKHSYRDFGMTLKSKNIGNPKKRKIKETVPYMNGQYDFSMLHGDQTYEERSLQYVFNLIDQNKELMNARKVAALNWLEAGCQEILWDDAIPGYYFLAECTDIDFKESGRIGELTATFTAYPFKIQQAEAGELLWDDFCFLTDYLQETRFTISGITSIDLYVNSAAQITPMVSCSADMSILMGDTQYSFPPGDTQDYRFQLACGLNQLTVTGNGIIEFHWHNEVI